MCCHHFGLSGPPFEFGSSPTALFMSAPHRGALAALEWGVAHETSGLTLLVGETGTGKTTLVSALLAQHRERVHAAYVLNLRLEIEEIMSLILEQITVKGMPPSRLGLWRGIEKMIARLKPGVWIVVIVDDAQDLTDERLEDPRLLSNCEANGSKRLHFILVGRPELSTQLGAPALPNINQRIGARAILNPLKFGEARSYVDYRLRQRGGSAPKIFNARALCRLIAQSCGIPQQINLLCNSAMPAAYAESADADPQASEIAPTSPGGAYFWRPTAAPRASTPDGPREERRHAQSSHDDQAQDGTGPANRLVDKAAGETGQQPGTLSADGRGVN
jgi:general secretion pathway protein A